MLNECLPQGAVTVSDGPPLSAVKVIICSNVPEKNKITDKDIEIG